MQPELNHATGTFGKPRALCALLTFLRLAREGLKEPTSEDQAEN